MKHNKRATAYHEAGHAVIACITGVGIRKSGVSIVSGEDSHGWCATRFIDLRSVRAAEKRVLVSLAGHAAQKKLNPRSVRGYHASADYQNAVRLLDSHVGSTHELEAYLRLLEIRTQQKVEHYWRQIEEFAGELLKRRHLSGQEATDIIRRSILRVPPMPSTKHGTCAAHLHTEK